MIRNGVGNWRKKDTPRQRQKRRSKLISIKIKCPSSSKYIDGENCPCKTYECNLYHQCQIIADEQDYVCPFPDGMCKFQNRFICPFFHVPPNSVLMPCLWEHGGKKCFNFNHCISYHGQTDRTKYIAESNKFDDSAAESQSVSNDTVSDCEDLKEDMESLKERNKRQYEMIKELEEKLKKFEAMEAKWNKYKNKLGYVAWGSSEIVEWIMQIESGRFEKYEDILLDNMEREEVDGECLSSFNENDLDRLGITGFKDKKILLANIRKLTMNEEVL